MDNFKEFDSMAIRCAATKVRIKEILESIAPLQAERIELANQKQEAQESLRSARATYRAADTEHAKVREALSDFASLRGVKNAIKGIRQIVGVESEADRIQREMDRLSRALEDIIRETDLKGSEIDDKISRLVDLASEIYGDQLLIEAFEDVSGRLQLAVDLLRRRFLPEPQWGVPNGADLSKLHAMVDRIGFAALSEPTVSDPLGAQLKEVAARVFDGAGPLQAKKELEAIEARRAAGYRDQSAQVT